MIHTREKIGLRPYNTMRLNSRCANWVEFDAPEDAPAASALAESISGENGIAIIGGGSNIIFGEAYPGVLIHPAIMGWDAVALGGGEMEVVVGAGVVLDDLVANICAAGLWGLENLSGIPGTVGGAAVQCAGAYGVEFGECVKYVKVWDRVENKFLTLSHDELDYGYRYSVFKHPENSGRYIVLQVAITVSKNSEPKLEYGPLKKLAGKSGLTPVDVRNEVLEIRDSKLPRTDETGSAGSYFKNPVVSSTEWDAFCERVKGMGIDIESVPHFILNGGSVKIPAAWLIDKCGWKGRTLGNAGVWHKQPLILINATGNATSDDILALEKAIVADVQQRFGIGLKPEVVRL
ncbi:MAG: UDP-N-acetylmuramate dehydrogenase [Paramuribaculum sp.]|nr:UDP-N-acetylmuramate dehydrogenase [Paramuribaculum sp.]